MCRSTNACSSPSPRRASLRPAADAPRAPVSNTVSPTRAPLRVSAEPSSKPRAVTETLNSEPELTSPPTMVVSPASAAAWAPSMAKMRSSALGPITVTRALQGSAPMAAMSESVAIMARQPRSWGPNNAGSMWTPITAASVQATSAWPGGGDKIAASSPKKISPSAAVSPTPIKLRIRSTTPDSRLLGPAGGAGF